MGFILHEICSMYIQKNSTPVYRFIKRRKLAKSIDEDIKQFMDLDVFRCSTMMISFMSSINGCKSYIHNIRFGDSFMDIYISDDTSAIFFVKSNRYEVTRPDISYTVYRNTEIPKKIKDDWKDMENSIKNVLLNCIYDISNALSEGKLNDDQ